MGLAEATRTGPPGRWIGHVACLPRVSAECGVWPSPGTRRGCGGLSELCCVPCSIPQISCEFVHALTFLASFREAFLETREETLPPQFSSELDSLLTVQSCRLCAGWARCWAVGIGSGWGRVTTLLTFVYVYQVPVCFTTQA